MAKKTDYTKLEKALSPPRQSCWESWGEKTRQAAFGFAEGYKEFLTKVKTEREAVREGVAIAKKHGFKDMAAVKELKPGDCVYAIQRSKGLLMAKIGKKTLQNGAKLVLAHVDAPHLDFKVNPLFEDENMAFLKTHYYGGIKKYQWPAVALALHGVVHLQSGEEKEIVIGEREDDPVFVITDLLPHLDRSGKPGTEIKKREVEAEHLNLLVGTIPVDSDKVKEKVRLAVLEYLHNEYGMTDDDFASAELQAVPCYKAKDAGFDRSMIAAYGQDDRICAYATFKSFLEAKPGDSTQICVWVDREEIGSIGNTGADSPFIESFVSEILKLTGESYGINSVNKVFARSKAISADVTVAVDPDYKDVFDLRNSHRLGFGVAVEKYVGSGGKYYTSEASASFINELRGIFNKNKDMKYQFGGGLGKIDIGGGGTIAMFLANRDIDVIDMGPALLNMHAPLEISSKADLYCAYLGYKAFLESA